MKQRKHLHAEQGLLHDQRLNEQRDAPPEELQDLQLRRLLLPLHGQRFNCQIYIDVQNEFETVWRKMIRWAWSTVVHAMSHLDKCPVNRGMIWVNGTNFIPPIIQMLT